VNDYQRARLLIAIVQLGILLGILIEVSRGH